MKPYTEYPMCPKCQRDRNQAFAYCDGSRCQRLYSKSEHLHCTCTSCGYEWLMECADAKPPDNPVQDIRCPHCSLHISLTIRDNQATAKSYGPHI